MLRLWGHSRRNGSHCHHSGLWSLPLSDLAFKGTKPWPTIVKKINAEKACPIAKPCCYLIINPEVSSHDAMRYLLLYGVCITLCCRLHLGDPEERQAQAIVYRTNGCVKKDQKDGKEHWDQVTWHLSHVLYVYTRQSHNSSLYWIFFFTVLFADVEIHWLGWLGGCHLI